jgi:hypothetical protein
LTIRIRSAFLPVIDGIERHLIHLVRLVRLVRLGLLDRLVRLVWWSNRIGIGMGEVNHPGKGRAKLRIRMKKLSHPEEPCGRTSTTRETVQRRMTDGGSRTRCWVPLRDISCIGRRTGRIYPEGEDRWGLKKRNMG